MNLMGYAKRLRFTEDIATVNKNTESLSIHGSVKNPALLSELPKLKKVYICTITQSQLEEIVPHINQINILSMYEVRCTNLDILGSLNNIKQIDLDWNTKISKLWDTRNNTELINLSINDFSKLNDVSNLKFLQSLNSLSLSGGMHKKMKLNSLSYLGFLSSLEDLNLSNLSIEDASQLRPLGQLKQLRTLEVSNQFSVDEYAYLSVKLLNTKCPYFKPYVSLRHKIGDKDTMVIGKGKPMVNSKLQPHILDKYSKEFTALQASFSNSIV